MNLTRNFNFCFIFVLCVAIFKWTNAGDKNRTERAKLNSADGNIAEAHDQFYRDHKLLLILFRVLAVMPITRSSPGENNIIIMIRFL